LLIAVQKTKLRFYLFAEVTLIANNMLKILRVKYMPRLTLKPWLLIYLNFC
jgi:hypothetical protein